MHSPSSSLPKWHTRHHKPYWKQVNIQMNSKTNAVPHPVAPFTDFQFWIKETCRLEFRTPLKQLSNEPNSCPWGRLMKNKFYFQSNKKSKYKIESSLLKLENIEVMPLGFYKILLIVKWRLRPHNQESLSIDSKPRSPRSLRLKILGT